jgi:transcription initiation factor TFIIIB Brf1 subunit/transcription initiation factor TFIIB
MKIVLVLFSLTLIQGCLVSNKEFEELDTDSSFAASAQSIKCMQMVAPQQPTPINDEGDTIEVYDQSDCYDDLAKKNIRTLTLELKKSEIVIDSKEEEIRLLDNSSQEIDIEEIEEKVLKKEKGSN